jgi:predicted Zn-dependent protease
VGEAIRVLLDLTARRPAYANAYLLLGDMYEKQGRAKEAENTYRKILADEGLSRQERAFIEAKLKKFSSQ